MENSELTCNMIFLDLLLQIFFCHISIALDANSYSESLSKHEINKINLMKLISNEIKSSISKWWKRNNVPEYLECKYTPQSAYSNKLFDMISAPEIKSYPCTGDDSSPHYYFDGTTKDNVLEGKGKLVFISDNEFSSLSNSDKIVEKVLKSKIANICFKAHDIYGRDIKEVDGAFKDGILHGPATITYRDNAISISNFIKGKASGFRRDFDTKKSLIDAGAYELGWKAGYHWILRFGHLMYQNREMIDDNASPVLVFPIADTGMLEDPIAGDYFPHSAALQNIRKVQLDTSLTSESDCLLHLKYELLDNENYTYSLSSRKKYPLYGQEGYNPLYNVTCDYASPFFTLRKKMDNFFNCIKMFLDTKTTGDYFGASAALEVLWQLKPESSKVNAENSTKLISDVIVNTDTKTATAVVLGSPPLNLVFETGDIKVDKDLLLNGFNDLSILTGHQQLIPRDKALGWTPIRIIGNFIHGELNGIVLLKTNVSTSVWATVKNGILHGPCVISGISYIIEQVSQKLFYLNHKNIYWRPLL